MRKMLNTLFVTTEDAYLSLENENIVVHVGEEKRAQYPLLMLEGIQDDVSICLAIQHTDDYAENRSRLTVPDNPRNCP